MNLFQFLTAVFGHRAAPDQLESVRKRGEEDGERAAGVYVDGFLAAADRVFQERLKAHETITVEPTSDGLTIESKPYKTKRFELVNGNGKRHAKSAK